MALMPRASFSSLSEPMAVLARTGNMKATYEVCLPQCWDFLR